MAHLHSQLGLQPLRLTPGALWNRWPGGQELLDTLLQLILGLAGQRQECGSRKLQLRSFLAAEIGNRFALIVVVGAEQDQLTFHDVLGLEPKLGGSAAIGAEGSFGNDPLKAHLTSPLEQVYS